jgi:hypothetical protein
MEKTETSFGTGEETVEAGIGECCEDVCTSELDVTPVLH